MNNNEYRLLPVALAPHIKDAIRASGHFMPESLWAAIIAAHDLVAPRPTAEKAGGLSAAPGEEAAYVHEFVKEYEWRTDEFCHTPTDREREMLFDFAVMLSDGLAVDFPNRQPAADAGGLLGQVQVRALVEENRQLTAKVNEWRDKLTESEEARMELLAAFNREVSGATFMGEPALPPRPDVTEMVNRFLGWKLPQDFAPDCGISFDGRKDDEWNKNKTWPVGTNLLTAIQAKGMFEYCVRPTAVMAGGLSCQTCSGINGFHDERCQADWIAAAIRDVAELPDRDSPPEWPDAMLVTAEELRTILGNRQPAMGSVDLPEWNHARAAVECEPGAGEATPIDVFLYNNEPAKTSDEQEFREQLQAALNYAAGHKPTASGAGDLEKDAARYRWLRDLKCNSLHVSRDDGHACNYTTAKDWIENVMPESFFGDDPAEVQAMKDANTIWDVQIYPNTPIGFTLYHGATLDAAIDAAMQDSPAANGAAGQKDGAA